MKKEFEKRLESFSPAKRKIIRDKLKSYRQQKKQTIYQQDLKDSTVTVAPQSNADISILFFSDYYDNQQENKYDFLLECAKFADNAGFQAIWTPERHYSEIGGLYSSPAVLNAALAMVTSNISLRAGSVVAPLHEAEEIVENWSVVDNLSRGRVGIAFASGWNPRDYGRKQQKFENRRELTRAQLKKVRDLWSGRGIEAEVSGKIEQLKLYPQPVSKQLPSWLTVVGEQSFIEAGQLDCNVLTSLVEQDIDECGRKIALYRQSLANNQFNTQGGKVTLMIHTYLDETVEQARAVTREPLVDYLYAFLKTCDPKLKKEYQLDKIVEQEGDRRAIAEIAFERYVRAHSLIGTVDSCEETIRKLCAIGVDEFACFIDYGVCKKKVMASLALLNELNQRIKSNRKQQNN